MRRSHCCLDNTRTHIRRTPRNVGERRSYSEQALLNAVYGDLRFTCSSMGRTYFVSCNALVEIGDLPAIGSEGFVAQWEAKLPRPSRNAYESRGDGHGRILRTCSGLNASRAFPLGQQTCVDSVACAPPRLAFHLIFHVYVRRVLQRIMAPVDSKRVNWESI